MRATHAAWPDFYGGRPPLLDIVIIALMATAGVMLAWSIPIL